jgi:hypothetical protein
MILSFNTNLLITSNTFKSSSANGAIFKDFHGEKSVFFPNFIGSGVRYLSRKAGKSLKKTSFKRQISKRAAYKKKLAAKKKFLPPRFYKKVYTILNRPKVGRRNINLFTAKKYTKNKFLIEKLLAFLKKTRSRSPNKNNKYPIRKKIFIKGAQRIIPLTCLKTNIFKILSRNHRTSKIKLWKNKHKWVWDYLKRIHTNKKFLRTYNRLGQWSFTRLRYSYIYDIFIYWFLTYFKKLANYLYVFFFQLWLNIYFSLVQNSFIYSWSNIYINNYGFTYSSLFTFTGYFGSKKRAAILTRGLWIRGFFIYSSPALYTNFFKLLVTYWYKSSLSSTISNFLKSSIKHSTSLKRKFKRSFNYRNRKYFRGKRYLRLRFRKQHGYGLVVNYFLRSQLRRLKRFSRRILVKTKKHFVPKFKWYNYLNASSKKKRIIAHTIHAIRKHSPTRLTPNYGGRSLAKRFEFLLKLMLFKKSVLLSLKKGSLKRKKLLKELTLLAKITSNIEIWVPRANFIKILYILASKKIIFLKRPISLKKSISSKKLKKKMRKRLKFRRLARLKKFFKFNKGRFVRFKRFFKSKRLKRAPLANFPNLRVVLRLFSRLMFHFFKGAKAQTNFSTFKKFVRIRLKNLTDFSKNKKFKISLLEDRVLVLGIKFLSHLVGEQILWKYFRKKFPKGLPINQRNFSLLVFLRQRLISLKSRAKRIKSKVNKLRAVNRKRKRKKKISCKQCNFLWRFKKQKRFSLKIFKYLTTNSRGNSRKRRARINRKKLLVVNRFKRLNWKGRENPLFLFQIEASSSLF